MKDELLKDLKEHIEEVASKLRKLQKIHISLTGKRYIAGLTGQRIKK